ncbi:MAG: adenylate/guanylate cyclase domain-containing protein [Rhodospirillaceae bacterium]|jgi:adenylate cyclase|nr:adenylate/guanylate cyclase domain-containing protein [Rhodospirillaceae bacterium]
MWRRFCNYLFGQPVPGDLPVRVQETIAAQQLESERLIGWVQMVLVIVFGTLYALAPPPAEMAEFRLEPWVLGIYFTFTLIRLICAYNHYLPDWLLIISVIMDIGVLMALIWSFHIKYAQPPSFYLKAPTLMYVFIFIAIRTLRFEPKYIVYTGATAVVGWLALVMYVVLGEAGETMVTRNYITYLTQNSILIGAEIDKMISIVVVTLVLTGAVVRARRTFWRSAIDQSAAEDLSRFVSREVANHITSADRAIQPGDGESRVASVVFTDIEAFSTVSEKLTPKQLAGILNEYFMAMGEVIDRHGGVIVHYQGDLMLITFNAVTPDDEHAANAVRTALAISELAGSRTFGDGHMLKTRCGVNTGEITVGAIGAEGRLAFTVHGDEVNIGARLEQLNKEHGTYVLVGENTAEACRDVCEFEPVTEVTVRGRSQPTRVFKPI